MHNSSVSSPQEANQLEEEPTIGDTLPPISTFSKKNQNGDRFAQVAAGTSQATPVNNAAYKVSYLFCLDFIAR